MLIAVFITEMVILHKYVYLLLLLLLSFPGKDVPNLVLNRKDSLWRICRKVARFSQQANIAPYLLIV